MVRTNGELRFPADGDGPVIERHYKTRELAERLGLHPETIRRAAQRGELESIRIGLDRIYSESAIEKWLAANLDVAARAHHNGNDSRLPEPKGGRLMAIRKRGRARWQVRVRPFPEMTVPTREAAVTVELDLKLRLKLGHLYREKPVSLGQELDGYLERKIAMGGRRGALRPSSIAFLEQSARPWEPLRHVPIPNLRRAMVEDRVAARAAVAPVAAANELELLKACLRAAASRGQAVDPAIFDIPPVRREPAEGVALELSQLHEIASTMPERIKRLVPFCGTVGLRFTEAVTLTDDRVDLEAREIVVPRDLNKSRRAKGIPLARVEVQLLREQLLARPRGTRLVFPNEKCAVYTKSGLRSIWLPALLAAGLAHEETNATGRTIIVADFRFHWLRHTAISLMARAGMKPELIAERVGHRDGGALIYRRYRHLFPSELRTAVGLLDVLVSSENAAGASSGSGQ